MKSYLGIFIICMLFLVLGILSLNQMFIYTPDSARYLVWSNSLAKFEGFKDATTPEPTRYVVHAPFYPILLSAAAFILPNNVIAAKFLTLLTGFLTILLLYLWLTQRVEKKYALLGALMLALNPLMLIFSTQILSDIPFALCLVLFFILLKKIPEDRSWGRIDYCFIAVVVAGFYSREVGLSFVFAAAAYFLWTKQYRRAAILFLISALFYALWFVRNEVIVADAENTLFRNSRLYLSHIYSTTQDGMIAEFYGRLINNVGIYAGYFGKMLFMPEFALNSYMMILPTDPLVAFVLSILPVFKYLIVAVTFGFTAVGLWKEFKFRRLFLSVSLFVFFYFAMILLYPVNDFRFLFPPMIIMIYFFVIGVKQGVEWMDAKTIHHALRYTAAGLFILLLIPNVVWIQNFVRNSRHFAGSSESVFEKDIKEPDYPEMFLKPLHLAGQWIVQNSDSNAVVYTYWKELAIWLDGRKVVVGSSLAASPSVDYQLRDYDVKYVVSVDWRAALNECEPQFAQLKNYEFIPVYKVGNVRVFEVVHLEQPPCKDKNIRMYDRISAGVQNDEALFKTALQQLEDDPQKAEPAFRELAARFRRSAVMEYYLGVAKEFIGQIDSAEIIFDKFGAMAQGSIFSRKAWQHKEVISWLKKGNTSTDPLERARIYHLDALNYWGMGCRLQAMQMLDRSIEADSNYLPAIATAVKYLLQDGRIDLAKKFLRKAKAIEPSSPFVENCITIARYYDSLKMPVGKEMKKELRLRIAKIFIDIGLNNKAVDELRIILCEYPSDPVALRALGELMEAGRRYAPALRYYREAQRNDTTNIELRNKINSLAEKF